MIEAMKQALEALDSDNPDIKLRAGIALRQAIAEAEKHEVSQEPVQVTIKDFVKAVEGKEDMVGRPVYWAQWPNADTHPQPKREQDGDCQRCGGKGCVACDAREQEPVAWMWRCKPYCDWPNWTVSIKRPADSGRDGNKRTEGYEDFPLYTLSPKREWVGLTDKDIWSVLQFRGYTTDNIEIAKAIEAKLKELNT